MWVCLFWEGSVTCVAARVRGFRFQVWRERHTFWGCAPTCSLRPIYSRASHAHWSPCICLRPADSGDHSFDTKENAYSLKALIMSCVRTGCVCNSHTQLRGMYVESVTAFHSQKTWVLSNGTYRFRMFVSSICMDCFSCNSCDRAVDCLPLHLSCFTHTIIHTPYHASLLSPTVL